MVIGLKLQVSDLEAKVEKLTNQNLELSNEIKTLKSQYNEALEALKRIDDFCNGLLEEIEKCGGGD